MERDQGNLIRSHQKLEAEGVHVRCSVLTAFGRLHSLSHRPNERPGENRFVPGKEMQHDTPPQEVGVSGRKRRLRCDPRPRAGG